MRSISKKTSETSINMYVFGLRKNLVIVIL